MGKDNMKEKDSKEKQSSFISKTIIPHYIIDYSINYNQYILPIYLFLKQRTNADKQIYFSYISLLDFFSNDKFSQKNEKDIVLAIIFLLQGVRVKKNEHEELIINTFQLATEENVLSNLLSNIVLQEDEREQTLELLINNKNNTATNKRYTVDSIINLIIKFLNNNHNVLLYDITKENITGYIIIKNSTLQYILWYFKHQTNNYNKLTQKYTLKDESKLSTLKEQYKIKKGKINVTKISYITLINMYIYIYKLFTINQNFNQSTTVSIATLSKKLSASNTTIKLYIEIMIDIKLLKVSSGKFKDKVITTYFITEDYESTSQLLDDFEVYRYSLVSKNNFNQILSCYERNNSSQLEKRGRGRPKKIQVL